MSVQAVTERVGRALVWWIVASLLLLSACQMGPAAMSVVEREPIDRLLLLIAQRLEVAEQVAQAKWNSGAPIDDPLRERNILNDLAAALPDESAANRAFIWRFFQAQFDAGKIIQRAQHAQWRREQHDRFAHPPDLARDIRPALDRLTPLLISSLRQVKPLLMQPGTHDYIQQRAAQMLAAYDPAVRDVALAALLTPS